LQEIKSNALALLQMQILADPRQRLKNQAIPDSSQATPSGLCRLRAMKLIPPPMALSR
jgi:hypothetical protein